MKMIMDVAKANSDLRRDGGSFATINKKMKAMVSGMLADYCQPNADISEETKNEITFYTK